MHDLKNDIEKYLAGKLTPAEMHALEKRALDDPFLADAIEGASTLDAPDFAADVSSLKAALQQRAQKKTTVVPLWQWAVRIAAGIIIVALSGYVMYYLMSPNDKPIELALNKPEDPQHPIPPPATDTKKEPSAPEFKNRIKTDKPVQQEATPASPETVTTAPTSAYAASHDVLAAEEPPLDPVANNPKEDQPARAEMMPAKAEAEEAASAYAVDKKKEISTASASQPAGGYKARIDDRHQPKILHGKVTDAEDGSPMPGVTVTVKGSNRGTTTDAEGYYHLEVSSKPADELVFSFVGMQSTEIPIASDSINAQLAADYASLSEVVVVGYGAASDGVIREEENDFQLAEPEGGRKAFKNYLIEKAQYPQLAIDNKIEGKVTIQFTLESNGLMNDFRILKGIGYGCDDEVIRLIKEGPKWTPTKRNDVPQKAKVKIRLKFILPR